MAANIKHLRKIDMSQETYDRLQQRAVPFEDTPESVIVKLLDESKVQERRSIRREDGETDGALDMVTTTRSKSAQRIGAGAEIDIVVDDPFSPPSLKHTKVLRAEVYPMNAVEAPKNDDGYTYHVDLGVSIQGQDANHAWQATAAVARALGVCVRVWFQWRTKPDAEYPGQWGLLKVG